MEVLQRTANRGSISTGYDIDNSLKFESDNNEYLERPTGGSDGSSTQHTISCWIKRTELGIDSEPVSAGGIGRFRFEADDTFNYQFRSGKELITNQVFRDTSAFYHIVVAADSSQATASNRIKVYVNGVQVTSFSSATYQDQDQASPAWGKNTVYNLRVGAAASSTRNFNGYIAEMYYIDGQTLDPTSFGEYDDDSGIWKPKAFTGTFGSLDTYLDFSDSSNLGNNVAGGTDMNATNITSADQATDTPTLNFATWNVLQTGWNTNYGTGQVIVEGATKAYASTNFAAIEGSMAVQSGKWYWESKPNRTGGIMVGVAALNGVRWAGDTAYWYLGMNAQGIGTIAGNWYYNGTSTSTDATDWTNGDIVSIALDMDNYKIYMAVNGSWGGTSNPSTGTGGYDFSSASNFTSNFVVPAGRIETANSSYVIETNYGGYTTMSIASGNSDSSGHGNFEYAPPSGYYALCTKNLAEFG